MTYIDRATFRTLYQQARLHVGRDLQVAIDFETNSNVPLKNTGLGRYSLDPQLQTLMAGIATRDLNGNLISSTFTIEDALEMVSIVREVGKHSAINRTYAHNSAFEMAVFAHAVNQNPRIRCTAMLARIYGANSHLEWAGPQLVGTDKLTSGKEFIDKFCMGDPRLVNQAFIDANRQLWSDGMIYCANDAEVSLLIAEECDTLEDSEWESFFLTHRMNRQGWHVDVDLVKRMQATRNANQLMLESEWRQKWEPRAPHPKKPEGQPLNLASPIQVKAYIERLGYTTKSTDKVAMKRLRKKASLRPDSRQKDELLDLINLKEDLGGSSLTKLDTLLTQVCEDDRLRYQYSHCGAGQSWRTSGVGVQMQNLKRLGEQLHDMSQGVSELTNPQLAENLRQVFFADTPLRTLLVSDLSSIEARVLAWMAWEVWKLEAIAEGKDLYKMLAMDIFGKEYGIIVKAERNSGKVGELGGGYGMGGQALKDFAEKMGIELTLDECYKIIATYREKNGRIKGLWYALNEAMINALIGGPSCFTRVDVGPPGAGYWVRFSTAPERDPINQVMAGTQMLQMAFMQGNDRLFWRLWRGCYITQGKYGSEVIYHRSPISPSRAKLWVDHSIDEETQVKYTNKLYGGKLTGVLVQSFARELFFNQLKQIDLELTVDAYIVGQFHDEVVIDTPLKELDANSATVDRIMSNSPFPGLPVGCEVKHAYRYTK